MRENHVEINFSSRWYNAGIINCRTNRWCQNSRWDELQRQHSSIYLVHINDSSELAEKYKLMNFVSFEVIEKNQARIITFLSSFAKNRNNNSNKGTLFENKGDYPPEYATILSALRTISSSSLSLSPSGSFRELWLPLLVAIQTHWFLLSWTLPTQVNEKARYKLLAWRTTSPYHTVVGKRKVIPCQ